MTTKKLGLLIALLPRSFLGLQHESAWNGQLNSPADLPGSPFTPFFVPDGATPFDDCHSAIKYASVWSLTCSPSSINQTLHSTAQTNATTTFSFTGTGLEWYGDTSPSHGIAALYLDDRPVVYVDGWTSQSMRQQYRWGISGLTSGRHTVRLVNTGKKRVASKGTLVDVDAFLVTTTVSPSYTGPVVSPPNKYNLLSVPTKPANAVPVREWGLVQSGHTGVHAMQLAIVSDRHAIIIDKVEHNPLSVDGHPAWGAVYDLQTNDVRPLRMTSNSFCAGGAFLSNGTLVNVGGNEVVVDVTSAADFGDVDGKQAVRLFTPCDDTSCDVYESPSRIRLASARWYNTVVRIDDGSVMIIGGSTKGGWMNNATTNNPTIEFYPPKSLHGYHGMPIPSNFLKTTLNSNLFPIAFSLPDGRVFIAANQDAVIYDWKQNQETQLPSIPNGVRVTYPMTGTGLLLPLAPENQYTPTILLCGGSSLDDRTPGYQLSSQNPASNQCSTLELTAQGIARGWTVESMPDARIMPDAVLLPDGRVLIVNGGRSGIAGYGNVRDVVGQSNADNPTLTPLLYDPAAPAGQRFSSAGMPISAIPRLYHSVASLTPNGSVIIAGSNPNLDRSVLEYPTEYRVEWLLPPYLNGQRPMYKGLPRLLGYGQRFVLATSGCEPGSSVSVSLMDLGYVTHAVHANSRLVRLVATLSDDGKQLTITGPPNASIYPPGPGWLYVLVNGVPSFGHKTLIGDGSNPPEDPSATEYMLSHSKVDKSGITKIGGPVPVAE